MDAKWLDYETNIIHLLVLLTLCLLALIELVPAFRGAAGEIRRTLAGQATGLAGTMVGLTGCGALTGLPGSFGDSS
jgi:hypothetical protein